MPAISASAPGKAILFGEHAVVYKRPAIAVPITQINARAVVTPLPNEQPGTIRLESPEVDLDTTLARLPGEHPMNVLFEHIKQHLRISHFPAMHVRIASSIPVAAGLGSGAAVSVAIIRAVCEYLGKPLPNNEVCQLAYQAEKVYHGTPSGIDNTVITYAQPIYFVSGQPFDLLQVFEPFTLVIADSGEKSSTAKIVSNVRHQWVEDTFRVESIFDTITKIVNQAREKIEEGPLKDLGPLMTANHSYLQQLGVSTRKLDFLVETAIKAGARGAKLSGAGGGGNMIALTTAEKSQQVAEALYLAGATRTFISQISVNHDLAMD